MFKLKCQKANSLFSPLLIWVFFFVGLGYEKGNKTDFFQHQDQFNSILSSLNSSTGNSDEMNNKSVSLEERSKNCKTRVQ